MNKFGTREMRPLIDRLRKASRAIYLATEQSVADDLSAMLIDAADSLEGGDGYYGAVESALV